MDTLNTMYNTIKNIINNICTSEEEAEQKFSIKIQNIFDPLIDFHNNTHNNYNTIEICIKQRILNRILYFKHNEKQNITQMVIITNEEFKQIPDATETPYKIYYYADDNKNSYEIKQYFDV